MPDEHIARLKDSRDDLVEWYDGLLASVRKWRAKVTYANFERQLAVGSTIRSRGTFTDGVVCFAGFA